MIPNKQAPLKPVFLTKKQREELKQKQEQEEKEREKKQQIDNIKQRKDFFEHKDRERKRRHRNRSRSRSKDSSRSRSEENKENGENPVERMDRKELEAIKHHYLSLHKEKRRLQKPSEKFKSNFVFEWDESEDTTIDNKPLVQEGFENTLLFGKGRLAGVDMDEQRANSFNYEAAVRRHDEDYVLSHKSSNKDKVVPKKFPALGEQKHWSKKTLEEMTERDWRIFREDHDIIIRGGRAPPPVRSWEEAKLPEYLNEAIRTLKFKKPTPIQMQALPIGLQRKDLMGLAPTGSGKTAAYLIPLITYLASLPPITAENMEDGPYGLIMCPTRELAQQVYSDFKKFAMGTRLKGTCVVGGRSVEEQSLKIRKGVDVIVATPGRMQDALESRYTVLNQCMYVVVDEADKMVEMNFDEVLNNILSYIPMTNMKSEDEQIAEIQERKAKAGEQVFRITVMFSATMPPEVEKIAKKYLRNPAHVSIGVPGSGKKDIEHRVEMLSDSEKKNRLRKILDSAEPLIIVFCSEKKACEYLATSVESWGWKPMVYHGGKNQDQREAAVEAFRQRKADILVATDVAARGLDVDGVKYVVNFDAPKSISDYVHRTGRTGRAGKKGIAYTFLTGRNEDLFYDLNEFLLKNNQQVPQQLADHPAAKVKPGTFVDQKPKKKNKD